MATIPAGNPALIRLACVCVRCRAIKAPFSFQHLSNRGLYYYCHGVLILEREHKEEKEISSILLRAKLDRPAGPRAS